MDTSAISYVDDDDATDMLLHNRASANAARSHVTISRPIYSQSDFDDVYTNKKDDKLPKSSLNIIVVGVKRKCKSCLPPDVPTFFLHLFPFISILAKYKWRSHILKDLITGATVACLHVPQAMAYGQLASLRPIHGLYVAFFPSLIYFLLGTSRQMSVGVFAVVSLMIAKVLDTEMADSASYGLMPNNLDNNSANSSASNNDTSQIFDYENKEMQLRIDIATSYNLVIGVLQLVLGLLGLGFITDYLNEPFNSGYTTACAFHVLVSQLWLAFGIKGIRHTGAFKIILTCKDLILNLPDAHWMTFGIFMASLVIFVSWKEFVAPRLKTLCPIPVPIELLVIVAADIISWALDLNGKYDVPVVGNIPSDFPVPTVPKYFRLNYLFDCIPIVLVSFSICISMGKMLGKKYKYEIRPTQEFIALGTCNIFGSFFSCFTASTALARTLVQSNVGGKTQLASLVSASIILIVILFLGAFLQPVPSCILASVVIANLKGMFIQFKEIPRFWRICRLDALIWVVSFLVTFLIDVDIGLYVGIGFILFTILFQTAQTKFAIKQRVPATELFAEKKLGKNLSSTIPAFVLQWSSPIYFANVESLGDAIQRGIYSLSSDASRKKVKKAAKQLIKTKDRDGDDYPDRITAVVLDLAGVLFIDTAGVEFLRDTVTELEKINVHLLLAAVPERILTALEHDSHMKEVIELNAFVAPIDALLAVQNSTSSFWGMKKENEQEELDATFLPDDSKI